MFRARLVTQACFIWLVSLVFACGGSTATTTDVPQSTAAAPSTSGAPAVVAEPAAAYTVLAEVRVANIRHVLDLAGVPLQGRDITSAITDLLGAGWLEVAADNAKLAAGVDLDGPLDFVIVGSERDSKDLMSAVSVPIKSVDEANAALKGDGKCRAEATPGGKARLVCSQSERENRALAPYMAKRDQAGPALVRIRLHATAFRDSIGKVAREEMANMGSLIGTESQMGRTANSVIDTLGSELKAELDDLETVEASLEKDSSGGVKGELVISFRSKKSWLAATIAKVPDPPVSAAYGALPRDRDVSASYSWPSKDLLSPVLEGVRDVIATILDQVQMGTPAERERIANIAFLFAGFGSPVITAQGFDPPRAVGGKATPSAQATEGTRLKEGWSLTWAPGRTEDVMRPYLEISEIASLPSIKAFLPSAGFSVKKGPGPRELGAESKELSFVTGAGGAGAPKTTTYTILMPGHGGVWAAFGVDRPRLLALLKEVRASENKTPEARPGSPVVGSEAGLIAQASVRSLLFRFLLSEEPTTALGQANDVWKKVGALPNKGRAELLVRGKSSTEPLKLSYKLTIPKEAVEDLATFAKGMTF
ncbi:MAG: hypothetical protein HOV80_37365 [Polyangiaceae bacterium]|nr:hypothetical protein [Polyangiaceae bacterium]